MNVHLAQLGERYDAEAMRQRTSQIERAFARVLSIETASPYALLTSPDGSVFALHVENNGSLRTEKIPKGRPV